jgi:hypothetical protein
MLFTVDVDPVSPTDQDENGNSSLSPSILFDFTKEDVPAWHLGSYLTELSTSINFVREGYYWVLHTNGNIPVRWLLMLQDFYWGFEHDYVQYGTSSPSFWEARLRELPSHVYTKLVERTMEVPKKQVRVLRPTDWETAHKKLSTSAKQILERTDGFLSLQGGRYERLDRAEGGIMIPSHRFIKEWNIVKKPPRDNDFRGEFVYKSYSYVPVEELTVLMEILRKLGAYVQAEMVDPLFIIPLPPLPPTAKTAKRKRARKEWGRKRT